jgi:2-dehydropantoate 2-reductase
MNSTARIAILGAGAVGSLIGGLLAADGARVTLIGRGAHIAAISACGLRIDGVLTRHVRSLAVGRALDFQPDIAIVTCKVEDLAPLLAGAALQLSGALVVLTQNGIRSHALAANAIDSRRLLSSVILFNARLSKPGVVTYVRCRPILVGAVDDEARDHVASVRAILAKVADTRAAPDIVAAQWTKLIVNAIGNGLDGMTGISPARCVREAGLAPLAVAIAREALTITRVAGIVLGRLPGVPLAAFNAVASAPMPIAAMAFRSFMGRTRDFDITTSTLQSLRRGRLTEIDCLNGELVRLGRSIGAGAPVNTRIVELVHEIERGRAFLTPAEVRASFPGVFAAG